MSKAGVGRVLNLPALASSALGEAVAVPGQPFSVQQLLAPAVLYGAVPRWLTVLRGEVIVDLPSGDFRVLRSGDGVAFAPGSQATVRSVASPALLMWHEGR